MKTIFRENASNFEKIYTIFMFFWMCLYFFGVSFNFKSQYGFHLYTVLISAAVSVILLTPLYFDSHPKNKIRSLSGLKRLKVWFYVFLLYFSSSWGAIGVGIPSIHTYIWGDWVSIDATVTYLGGSSKHCRRQVKVDALRGEYCVDRSVYSVLSVGDKVIIKVRNGALGFKVYRFRKIRS